MKLYSCSGSENPMNPPRPLASGRVDPSLSQLNLSKPFKTFQLPIRERIYPPPLASPGALAQRAVGGLDGPVPPRRGLKT